MPLKILSLQVDTQLGVISVNTTKNLKENPNQDIAYLVNLGVNAMACCQNKAS